MNLNFGALGARVAGWPIETLNRECPPCNFRSKIQLDHPVQLASDQLRREVLNGPEVRHSGGPEVRLKTRSSPRKSTVDSSPRKSTLDLSPRKSTVDSSPRKSTVDSSPRKSIVDTSPRKSTTIDSFTTT